LAAAAGPVVDEPPYAGVERGQLIAGVDPAVARVSTLAAYVEALGGRLDVTVEVDDQRLKIA
jgi:hypothetical protein